MTRREFLTLTAGAVGVASHAIGSAMADVTIEKRPEYMFFDAERLEEIKRHVANGEEPWATAHAEMLKYAEKALGQEIVFVKGGGPHVYNTEPPYKGWSKVDSTGPDARDGQINPQADRSDYYAAIALDNAVRNLGFGYVLTGEAKYAEKAIELLRAWTVDPDTYMEPRLTNGQSHIELFITTPGYIYGGHLIDGYDGWDAKTKDGWKKWVHDFTDDLTQVNHRNNFENWKLVLMSTAGVLLEDDGLLDAAFARWREVLEPQMGEDGHLVFEIGRTKSVDYSTYAVNAMTQTAEIARQHGVDLYGYTLPDGRGLERTLDFHAPHAVDQSDWPHKQIAPYKGHNTEIYEVAHAWKQKDAYRAVVEHWGRPMYERRVMGPVTLTHGLAFD